MSSRLNEGRVAIIIGAGGDIGHEIALALADSGARVVINGIGVPLQNKGGSTSPAGETLGPTRQQGGEGLINTDSVADWDNARHIVEYAMDGFGCLDTVINNAGILRGAISCKMNAGDWLSVINIHLSSSFFVSRTAARRFRTQQAGTFVHMASTSGLIGSLGQANYSAAKPDIVALNKPIVFDVQRYNVRSNCIVPFA